MGTCMCISESLCCSPDTIALLVIGYTPIQNKRLVFFLKKKRKKEKKTSPSNTVCAGLIPGSGAEIPHSFQPRNQNIKQKQYYNKLK